MSSSVWELSGRFILSFYLSLNRSRFVQREIRVRNMNTWTYWNSAQSQNNGKRKKSSLKTLNKLKLKCLIETMGQGSCEKPVSQEKKRFQWRRIILKSFRRAWKALTEFTLIRPPRTDYAHLRLRMIIFWWFVVKLHLWMPALEFRQ